MPAPYPNTPDDFWRFVNKTDGCWLWIGGSRAYRYGSFRFNGKHVAAHRFSWELANGLIPDGLHCLHKCDNGFCVRPDHLFLGTHQDNMDDKEAKGRGNQAKGSANGFSKLTESMVAAIRYEYAGGVRQVDLAVKYGIGQTHISRLVRGEAWMHLPTVEAKHQKYVAPPRIPSRRTKKGVVRAWGSKHGMSRLTDGDVLAIREAYRNGARQVEIAARFGITQTNVSVIVFRKTWTPI